MGTLTIKALYTKRTIDASLSFSKIRALSELYAAIETSNYSYIPLPSNTFLPWHLRRLVSRVYQGFHQVRYTVPMLRCTIDDTV